MVFELVKYLGKWYEVARVDNSFEPNMRNVTAEYNLKLDGNIEVINSAFIFSDYKRIIGTAKTTDDEYLLKVSFFNDEYSDYRILFVDEDYQYAVVGGNKENYMWILSRTPHIDDDKLNELLEIAKEKGYNVEEIIKTIHTDDEIIYVKW